MKLEIKRKTPAKFTGVCKQSVSSKKRSSVYSFNKIELLKNGVNVLSSYNFNLSPRS